MTPEWPAVPRPEPLPDSVDVPCGAVLPFRPDDPDVDADRLGLCVDDSPCGRDAHYAVDTADSREVAVCGQHRPSGGGYERERTEADGGRDEMPSDPIDRSPDDYDVSDHPAAEPPADGVDRGDGPVADGGHDLDLATLLDEYGPARVATDGGVESWGTVTDGPRPGELARELQQKAAVRAAHADLDCRGPAVEIVLAERFDAVPARVARPIYRRGLGITDVSTIAGTHLQVTAEPGRKSA
jgi:hypothetical protein